MKRYSIFKRIVAGIGMITLLSGSLGINTNAVFADAPAAVTAADGTSVSTAADAATDPNAANGVQAPGADDGANTPATSDPSNAGQNGQGNTALTSLTASMDGITVTASFDAGTFPDGTVLSLSGVSEEMLNAASEAASAEAKANGETASTVKEVRGVDITFAEGGTGAVLQPADGRSVQITMSGVFAGIESNQAVKLYHFASANPEAAAASVENGNITFTGTSFSPFVPVLLEPAAKEASLDASLLGSNGKAMESGSTLKLTDFRGKSGALTAALTLEENSSNHKLIYKLPEWFSWYEVKDDPNGAYKVTVSTDPNTKYGSNNILEVQFLDTSEAEGKEFSFSFRLNEDSMPDEYIKELQQNGFEEMVFSVEQQWTASDGTVKSTEPTVITEGYQWTLPKDPTYYFGE